MVALAFTILIKREIRIQLREVFHGIKPLINIMLMING